MKHKYRVQLVARFSWEQDAIGEILAEKMAVAMTEYLFALNFPRVHDLAVETLSIDLVEPPRQGG